MANERQLVVRVVGDASSMDRALKKAERSATGFSGKMQSKFRGGGLLGGALGGVGKAGVIGAGIAAGSALALKGLSSVAAAAKDAQVAQVNLDQAFKASGTSQARYGKAVDATIQRVSKLAAIDDEEVSAAFASLLRTTGSVAKATRDVGLAANIARARHISLAAAAKIVEKAENGQTRGLKALGVQVGKNTTTQQALDRAQAKFAGSAAAYGSTAAGAQDKYRVALENVEERIGAKLLPLQTKLALAAVRFLDWSEQNWPRFAKAISGAYQTAKPAIDHIVSRVRDIADVISGTVKIINALRNGDWSKAWGGIKQVAVAQIDLIYDAFLALPVKIAKGLGQAAFTGIERAFTAALNRIISIINRAIRAYNKIPLAPNLPTVPSLGPSSGSGSSPSRSRATASVAGAAPAFTNYVTVEIDGRKVESTVTKQQQKRSRRNPPKRTGR